MPAKLSVLRRSTVSFHRTIRVTVAHLEEVRRKRIRRERRELFASLPGGVSQETLDAIGACESGGDPTAVSSDGSYRGKYQFDYGTWESVGGSGDPAAAPEQEQDYRAALLYAQSGSSPWPVCG
ncbi:MAG TPA: transglycosylase family protein [Solirubrobacterales bacterium]|nr:transglycosylase family protein [Solirubrobacterales bacterium]